MYTHTHTQASTGARMRTTSCFPRPVSNYQPSPIYVYIYIYLSQFIYRVRVSPERSEITHSAYLVAAYGEPQPHCAVTLTLSHPIALLSSLGESYLPMALTE